MRRETVVQLVAETADVRENGSETGTVDGEHPGSLSATDGRRRVRVRHAAAVRVQGEGVERPERLREVPGQD